MISMHRHIYVDFIPGFSKISKYCANVQILCSLSHLKVFFPPPPLVPPVAPLSASPGWPPVVPAPHAPGPTPPLPVSPRRPGPQHVALYAALIAPSPW